MIVNVNHLHSLTEASRIPSENEKNAKYARFTFGQHVGGEVKKKKRNENENSDEKVQAEFLA